MMWFSVTFISLYIIIQSSVQSYYLINNNDLERIPSKILTHSENIFRLRRDIPERRKRSYVAHINVKNAIKSKTLSPTFSYDEQTTGKIDIILISLNESFVNRTTAELPIKMDNLSKSYKNNSQVFVEKNGISNFTLNSFDTNSSSMLNLTKNSLVQTSAFASTIFTNLKYNFDNKNSRKNEKTKFITNDKYIHDLLQNTTDTFNKSAETISFSRKLNTISTDDYSKTNNIVRSANSSVSNVHNLISNETIKSNKSHADDTKRERTKDVFLHNFISPFGIIVACLFFSSLLFFVFLFFFIKEEILHPDKQTSPAEL